MNRRLILKIVFVMVALGAIAVWYMWDQARLQYAAVFPEGHSVILNSFDGDVRVSGEPAVAKQKWNGAKTLDVASGAIARITFASGWYIQFDGPGGFEILEQVENAKGTEKELRVRMHDQGILRAMAPTKPGLYRIHVEFSDGVYVEKEGGEISFRLNSDRKERVAWFSGEPALEVTEKGERRILNGTGLNAF